MTGRQGGAGPGAGGHGGHGGSGAGGGHPIRGRAAPAGAAGVNGRLHRRLGCADLRSVPEVRRVLRELLRQWGGSDTAGVAELLASELVTNALVHTEHGAVVTATVASSTLRVEVRDFMAHLPVSDHLVRRFAAYDDREAPEGQGSREAQDPHEPHEPHEAHEFNDVLDTHGRGLALVQSLADAWGVRTQSAGKVVWFELHDDRSAA
ncbi:ATP-binding protein [Streptomyces sp. NPDC055078]